MKIMLHFAKGDVLIGELSSEWGSPQTVELLKKQGPFSSLAKHSRYCGREVYFAAPPTLLGPKEKYSIFLSKGDIIYWRAWRDNGMEPVLSFYYGPEYARSNQGDEPVNIIGHLHEDLLPLAVEIGERVWLQGAEEVQVEIVQD
jgi:hypothetical protein